MSKKPVDQTEDVLHDMRPEYTVDDMKGAMRGKYAQAYGSGHTVRITREDGTTAVQQFRLDEGAVLLEPDVRAFFPDSASVNRALRGLIALAPSRRRQPTRRV